MKKRHFVKDKEISKYFFWAVLAILILLSYFIVKSYLIPLVSSLILAYLSLPIYRKLSAKINKRLSALLCILLIFIIVVVPIMFATTALIQQISSSLTINDITSSLDSQISKLPFLKNIDLTNLKQIGLNIFLSAITSTISSIPFWAISILIMFFGIYYSLLNWEQLSSILIKIIPSKEKEKTAKDISTVTKQLIYGYVLIALIEFLVALIGFYFSGVKSFVLLPFLIALFAFIPGIGPGVIWIPTAVIYFIIGDYPTAIGVLITGLIISIVIETFIYSKIMGKKSRIHPLIILIGVFGGVPLFGIFGFIIGPLILIYAIKLIEHAIN